jgi:hypothetical protein
MAAWVTTITKMRDKKWQEVKEGKTAFLRQSQ